MNNKTLREVVFETLDTYAQTFKETRFFREKIKIDKKAFEYIDDMSNSCGLDDVQRENLKNYYVSKKYDIK